MLLDPPKMLLQIGLEDLTHLAVNFKIQATQIKRNFENKNFKPVEKVLRLVWKSFQHLKSKLRGFEKTILKISPK